MMAADMPVSFHERFQTVEEHLHADTVQSIPKLALLDRQASGWGSILIRSIISISIAALVFTFSLALVTLWLAFTMQYIREIVDAAYPGRGTMALGGVLIAAVALLALSPRLRDLLADRKIWRQEKAPETGSALFLTAVAWLVRLMMIAFVATFALFFLLPYVFAIGEIPRLIGSFVESRPWAGITLTDDWEFVVVGLIVLFALVMWLRQLGGQRLLRLTLIVFWLLGLALMAWIILSRLRPDWLPDTLFWPMSRWAGFVAEDRPLVINLLASFYVLAAVELWGAVATLHLTPLYLVGTLALLAIVYPLEMVFPLSRLLTLPYNTFHHLLTWMVPTVRLRWRIGQALACQRRRNREQTRGDYRATVCRKDLIRFVSSRARRSYMRSVAYYYCPTCEKDNDVYNGVHCMALLFSKSMATPVLQYGSNLYLNGLGWLNHHDQANVPIFDAIVIDDVDKHDVELFVTLYRNYEAQLKPPHKRLERIAGRVATNAQLNPNTVRLLEDSLAWLTFGFKDGENANACANR